MTEVFAKPFTQQEPIPEEGIAAAVAVLRHGRLHRYNTLGDEIAETALLEEAFAAATGARYCLAVASGGYALGCALRAAGVGPGDAVLTNAFTLAPVPGAIAALGARPVLVETTENLTIDFDDLDAKARASGARVLMLSHMRGHICDMDRMVAFCAAAGLTLIEDCAHTMGAAWAGTPSGRHGAIGCYSTQTYKHMNAGEGGLVVTDDADLAARMILLSGSYMLYPRHRAAPGPEVFERLRYDTPNVSGRMDNLRAAILRPQIPTLPDRVARWNRLYGRLETALRDTPGVALCHRPQAESFVGSSFQFRLPGRDAAAMADLVRRAAARGVELKWFGAAEPAGFTSRHDSWRYAGRQSLPQTDRVLATLLDLRLPLTFTEEDVACIGRILVEEIRRSSPGG
ncbi:MAG: DegT/DnrJ/EryC1/StrS family aminotransferase [Pseudomonadota bacterium]